MCTSVDSCLGHDSNGSFPPGQTAAYSLFAIFDGDSGKIPTWNFPSTEIDVLANTLVVEASARHNGADNVPKLCNVSGLWQFGGWPKQFELTFVQDGHNFSFSSPNPTTPWRNAHRTLNEWGQVNLECNCTAPGCHGLHGEINTRMAGGSCDTIVSYNPYWIFNRGFRPPPKPRPPPRPARALPTAHFSLEHGRSTTLRVALVIGHNESDCHARLARLAIAPSPSGKAFDSSWANAASQWEARWQEAFTPGNEHYSGSLPVLSVEPDSVSVEPTVPPAFHPLERMYYMGVLTLLMCQRNNLPIPTPPPGIPPQLRI